MTLLRVVHGTVEYSPARVGEKFDWAVAAIKFDGFLTSVVCVPYELRGWWVVCASLGVAPFPQASCDAFPVAVV